MTLLFLEEDGSQRLPVQILSPKESRFVPSFSIFIDFKSAILVSVVSSR